MSDPTPAAPQSPEERRFIGWLTLASVVALALFARFA